MMRQPVRIFVPKSVLAALLLAIALAGAVSADSRALNETFPSSMHSLILNAPKARLLLYVASSPEQIVGALRCRHHLNAHTGVLYSYSDRRSLVLAPRNAFLTTDEIIIDRAGNVASIILNEPAYGPTRIGIATVGFWTRARYVIDLASGELDEDGITVGTHFRIPNLPDLIPFRQHPVLALPCKSE